MNRIGARTNDLDKHFKLMADIDLSVYVGMQFRRIGSRRSTAFRGVFDGNGKRIRNLTYTSTNRDNVGLFGYVRGSEAEIRNLELVNPNIDAGTKTYVGSLVGYSEGTITNCYATGGTTGNDRVGGLVGRNTWPAKITNCYSVGAVTGTTDVGGLVGFNDAAVIKSSFWDTQTSGRSEMCGQSEESIGCDNDNGKTTAQMQRKGTFMDASWDFDDESENGTEDIWIICDGLDYPEFARQFVTGDFDGDNQVDLEDFAFLAERWLSEDLPFFWCRGADLTGDGEVGVDDLREFADNWLVEGVPNLTGTVYLMVDDFESYNDLDPADPESNRIFDAWLDGYDSPATNGSIVGHTNPPFAERQIVYGGRQSMPYLYNTLFKFAKAELTLSPLQNWAEEGAEVLSLWFRGDSSNAPVPMSVILNGSSTVYHDDPDATQLETWTQWIIDIEAVAGVDLAGVNSIAICFGHQSGTEPGGSGVVFFDDIRLAGPG